MVSPWVRRRFGAASCRHRQGQDLLAGELHAVGLPSVLLGGGHELVVRVAAHHATAVAVDDLGHANLPWGQCDTTKRPLVDRWKGSGDCLGRYGYGCWAGWGSSTGNAGSMARRFPAARGGSSSPTSRCAITPFPVTSSPTSCGLTPSPRHGSGTCRQSSPRCAPPSTRSTSP